MTARKNISASLRWQVFARDGFRCRYCGLQAGEPGVTLHADHVLSVADGGTNAMDNLVAACQRCNGGKAARSLSGAPGSTEAIERAKEQAALLRKNSETLRDQQEAIAAQIEAKAEYRQEVINLLCQAYGRDEIRMSPKAVTSFVTLTRNLGAGRISDWVHQAAKRGVASEQCLPYVYGIIRRIRQEQGEGAL